MNANEGDKTMSETSAETTEEKKVDEAEETSEGEEVVEELKAKEEEKAEKEEEDFKAKYFYLAAEMENMRKRFDREKENLVKYGNEKILNGLIEVIDNFDRTVDSLASEEDEKIKNIVTGIEMVRTQFLETLKSNGLERIEALGEKFDPNFHEAVSQQEVEGEEEDKVIQEFQKGYMLNGRLLRASKVIISK